MPIYEYQCQACHHEFEVIQKITDDPLKKCPICNKGKVQKLISESGFQLKGSGWYVTDYKNKGKKPSEEKKAPQAKPESKPKSDKKSKSE